MRDRTKITMGLGVFFLLAAYPVWHAFGARGDPRPPELERATEQPRCVEDTLSMVALHPHLLDAWRTAVVRDGERFYVSADGARFEMSLTGTCMRCHTNSQAFCERCHTYAGVAPRCWHCHVAPEGP